MGIRVNQVTAARLQNVNEGEGIFSNVGSQGPMETKVVVWTRPDLGSGTSARAINGISPKKPFEMIAVFNDEANERFESNKKSRERELFLFTKMSLRKSNWGKIKENLSLGTSMVMTNLSQSKRSELSGTNFYSGTVTETIRLE